MVKRERLDLMKKQGKSLDLQKARAKYKKVEEMEEIEHQGRHMLTGNRGRSVGSEFAMAVDAVKEQAKAMRGSQVGFLGVEKKNIETKELASNDKLSKCKSKEARKKERK